MRIAFCGSHRTGKTSLIDELSQLLPGYVSIDEPYNLMTEEGYEFCHPPSLEDFEAQLERSIESLTDDGADVLFDRCPVDILGYLLTHADADSFALDDWMPRVSAALEALNLIVFVPIEERDRIRFSAADDDGSRSSVDEKLRELLLDDAQDFGVDVITVEGDIATRARTVIREMRARA